MDKFTNYYGIDISKNVFDVVDGNDIHYQFENNLGGFKNFSEHIEPMGCCVMEATGAYHSQLANYLHERGVFTSVVNPLVIKRFIQMNLRRIKTDKADAQMICKYAQINKLQPYQPAPIYVQECRIISDHIDLLIKSRTMFKNRLHAMKHKADKHRKVLMSPLEKIIKDISKQVDVLEKELKKLIEENDADLFSRLQTIPGIGKATAMFLIVLSEGFEKFESPKQFTAFVGLSPVEKRSGSSVRGSSRISKQGNGKLRNLLFMCSFNACKSNAACNQLYERIVAKGKSKKLALIAVANKLIKQSFAIAKSGLIYDPNYRSVQPRLTIRTSN